MATRKIDGVAERKPQVRVDGLGAGKRDVFLATLAQTCSVESAAQATGAHRSSFYALRLREPDFAAQWIEALRMGYDMVEEQLLRYVIDRGADEVPNAEGVPNTDGVLALDGVSSEVTGGDPHEPAVEGAEGAGGGARRSVGSEPRRCIMLGTGLPADRVPAWVQVGILLLNKHRATVDGGKLRGRSPRIGTPAETDALLTRKLDQLARSIRRSGGSAPDRKVADNKVADDKGGGGEDPA